MTFRESQEIELGGIIRSILVVFCSAPTSWDYFISEEHPATLLHMRIEVLVVFVATTSRPTVEEHATMVLNQNRDLLLTHDKGSTDLVSM